MKNPILIVSLLISPLLAEADKPQLLRLSNGELEGQFGGINQDGLVTWHRRDSPQPLEFQTKNIRQISFPQSNAIPTKTGTSYVTLINQDEIPGKIIAIDESTITIESPICGTAVIARNQLANIKPNPFGGRLIYIGPYNKKGWESLSAADDGPEAEADQDASTNPWHQRGSYWYSIKGNDVLALKDINMPAQSVFQFHLEWRSRPTIEVGFYADFQAAPQADAEDNEDNQENRRAALRRRKNSNHAERFGNAFVMTYRSHYVSLHHCGYDDKGNAFSHKINGSTNRINIDRESIAKFELRSDIKSGTISLYTDDQFAVQWDLKNYLKTRDIEPPSGKNLGFYVNRNSEDPVKISDVLVAEWNGVPDSARSLENDQFDIILLTNGTDRFAGKVISLNRGKLELEGHYATLNIPLEDIAEIQFAKATRAEHSPEKNITLYYQPYGRISGSPIQSSKSSIKIRSPLLGEMTLDLSTTSLIDFHPHNSFLNFWEEDL